MKLDKDTKALGTKIIRATIIVLIVIAALFILGTLGPTLIKGY